MKTKFTPAPWGLVVKHDGFTSVGRTTCLARVYSQNFRDIENEKANAHLIAAAPELYESLVLVTDALEAIDGDRLTCVKQAKQALAKARGES